MKQATQCIVLLCTVFVLVNSVEKTQMYMKRSEVSDQSMSGSGYSYNIHDGTPQEFSFENDDEDKTLKILRDLGYDPFAEVPRYAPEHLPVPFDQYYKEYLNVADKKPLNFKINHEKQNIPEAKFSYESYSPLDKYEKITYPPLFPYAQGYGHDSHDAAKFLKEGGKVYSADDFAKQGEKVDTAYKTVDAFDKALKGSYDKEDRKSHYNRNGGAKQSFHDAANNYASNNAAGQVSLGESFGQKKGHNKGSKTTGYHKVYHKDDYNKQHKFYDKADRRGHFSKYGDHNAKNGNENGYFVKGGRADQGYDNKEYGVKGASDQGKFEDGVKGFKSADGNQRFYSDYAGFGKNGGQESGSEQGYTI